MNLSDKLCAGACEVSKKLTATEELLTRALYHVDYLKAQLEEATAAVRASEASEVAARAELEAVKRRVIPHGGVHSPEFTAAFEALDGCTGCGRCAP